MDDLGVHVVGVTDRFRQFFHACPSGLAEVDAEGRVTVVNPAAVSLLGPAMTAPDVSDLGPVLTALVPDLVQDMRAPGPEGPVGHAVACTSTRRDTWVDVEVVRLAGDRFLVVVHDVTTEQRLAHREAHAALEINDTVVQTLVAAETALDLGRTQLGRDLVGEASRASREWIGQQLLASGGARPGAVRRESPARPTAGGPDEL